MERFAETVRMNVAEATDAAEAEQHKEAEDEARLSSAVERIRSYIVRRFQEAQDLGSGSLAYECDELAHGQHGTDYILRWEGVPPVRRLVVRVGSDDLSKLEWGFEKQEHTGEGYEDAGHRWLHLKERADVHDPHVDATIDRLVILLTKQRAWHGEKMPQLPREPLAQASSPRYAGPGWEYKWLRFWGYGGKVLEPLFGGGDYEEDGVDQQRNGWQRLQVLGREGWEFVVAEDTYLVLKRPLE